MRRPQLAVGADCWGNKFFNRPVWEKLGRPRNENPFRVLTGPEKGMVAGACPPFQREPFRGL